MERYIKSYVGNSKKLLENAGSKSLKAFMLENNLNQADAKLFLIELYNQQVDVINEEIKKKQKAKKQLDSLTNVYNNKIINTEFVPTTMSDQISLKFMLGEYSIKTKVVEFLKKALDEMAKLPMYKKLNKPFLEIRPETDLKFIKKIYDLLMTKAGDLNRIFITDIETGKVVSSKLKEGFTYEDFEDVLLKIIQSAGLAVIGNLTFTIQYRNLPVGGNLINKKDIPSFLIDKRGISIILNDDGLCGQRCLVLADRYMKNEDAFKNIKKDSSKKLFDKLTNELCKELNVNNEMNFTDFDKYADNRKIQVIILTGLWVELYVTPTEYEEQIYLYYDMAMKHYHYLHDINAATNDSKRQNKWCKSCRKSIRRENFEKHKCKETKCSCCHYDFKTLDNKNQHFSDARKNKSWLQCDLCNVWCAGEKCLTDHQEKCKGDTIKCLECNKFIDKNHYDNHICGEKYCINCDVYHSKDDEHRCYIKKLKPEEGEWLQKIYAYDFESMFDENNNHEVNLCIVSLLNGDEEYTFNNIEEFVQFAVSCKNSTFIAHNGKAYDNWLTHKYIIKHTGHRPSKLIMAGNKIMYMKVKSVRFIDSLNHIAQGLATFPSTFGIKEMKKGFFPYLFNIKENQNYIGKIPDKKYFNTYSMSCEKLEEFNIWYDTQLNIVYDFKKELYEYCKSDVDILKRSLEIYISDAIEINGLHPLKCSTIASYCMKVYRTNYMNEDEIAILTKEEYDFCKRGFFGGRTEVFKMFQNWSEQQIAEGTFGKYVDIQSLYPTVQFFDDLPCDIPIWDINPNVNDYTEYLNNKFGYVECDISCPKNLHIPLLPEKKDGKLIFDLVDKKKAVYTSIELKRALEVGYKITHIYKTLCFNKTDNMFKKYVQNFLKIKTESAGYDGDNIDEYINRYYQHCGVLLDKNKIKENAGMKLLAKICLNSLWGKFGQNDELPTTVYLKNDAWFKLLKRHTNNEVELKTECLIDEDTLYVSYIEKVENRTSLTTTNLALAGFTTGNARLRLYKELYKLGERVIYCDTDSIIYEYRKNEYNVEEGDCLGQWELEEYKEKVNGKKIKHEGNLKEVYALAPKTYGVTTLSGYSSYKCKGITLNSGNKQHFNYERLKDLISGSHKPIVTYSDDFIKDKKTGCIYTKTQVEKVTNFDAEGFKRNFNLEDGTSKPFI